MPNFRYIFVRPNGQKPRIRPDLSKNLSEICEHGVESCNRTGIKHNPMVFIQLQSQFYNQYYKEKQPNPYKMNFSYEIATPEPLPLPKPISHRKSRLPSHTQPQKITRRPLQERKTLSLDKKEKVSWNSTESKRYLKFLMDFQHLFQKANKRKLKLNVKMSKVVKSRDPSQCHSHHQKMLLKHGSIHNIILGLNQSLKQKVTSSDKMEIQEIQPEEVIQDDERLEVFALNFDFSLPYQPDENLGQVGLVELQSYQYNVGNNWDDCL